MDVGETPDDDLRDPLTPVDLLLPGAWRTPRPDRRASRRPGDGLPLAPPPPVVRSLSTPPTLPLPLGDLADVAPAPPSGPPAGPPDAPAVPAALPPLPQWSAAAEPRAVGSRSVLGAAAGLVVVGGVSLWLGLLPTGGGSSGPAQPAASNAAQTVVPASEPSTQAPTKTTTTRPATKTPAATRTPAAPRTSTTRRSSAAPATGTVLVDPRLYVGRPAKQAERALRRLGLTVEVQVVTTGLRRQTAGVVVAVSPTGRVPAGSTVLLVVRA